MAVAVVVIAQAVLAERPAAIDLDAAIRPLRCREHRDEIVVCGRKAGDDQRLVPLQPPGGDGGPLRAERNLGNAKAAIETEAVELGPGVQSNRLMFPLKVPIGKPR